MSINTDCVRLITTELRNARALLGIMVYGGLALFMPREEPVSKNQRMDWVGSVLGVCGLIIFNFVWKYVSILSWLLAFAFFPQH